MRAPKARRVLMDLTALSALKVSQAPKVRLEIPELAVPLAPSARLEPMVRPEPKEPQVILVRKVLRVEAASTELRDSPASMVPRGHRVLRVLLATMEILV